MTSRIRRSWVRWYARQRVPTDHIAALVDADLETVRNDLVVVRQKGKPRLPLRGNSPHHRRPARRAILAQTANHVDRLRQLGYDADAVARILVLDLIRVTDYLHRTAPIRRAALSRPRGHKEEEGARRNQARTEAHKRELAAWGNRREPPPAVRSVIVAPAETAARELDASAAADPPAMNAPPAPNPWTGPTSLQARGEANGQSKLTTADVLEIRRLHAAGRSIYSLAPQFGVSKSNIRAIVRGETWTELLSPAPPAEGPGA